jgi:hypothetical protein
MAITLMDFRAAVPTYLNTSVLCTIPSLVPDVPSALSPGDGFTYSLQARNAPAPAGVALTNVRYQVRVVHPAIGALLVPSPLIGGLARAGAGPHAAVLAPGTWVAAMILYPPFLGTGTALRRLDVGETDTLSGLKGCALARGALELRVCILADPDNLFRCPRDAGSSEGRRTIQVI